MIHAWGLDNFRDRNEYLRGLTDNFLRDTLNLLARAGKARKRGDAARPLPCRNIPVETTVHERIP